ncbi:MAG: DUF3145 domain-containing protein [Actinomycetota bacterium]|nr:DUF3145 domain-containing protein [Actinomycetota bacterium]
MSSSRTSNRATPTTRGVVFVHCCPSALAPHVEWALAGVLGRPVRLQWSGQPAAPAHLRAEASWTGAVGTGARLAASVRAWPMLVFEVTEEATSVSDGERLAYVPGRGFHRSMISANGDVVVGEERIRGLLSRARTAEDFQHGLTELLGSAWDAELEPYRLGGDGAPVSLLHQVV